VWQTLTFFCFSKEMNESRDLDSYKIGFLNGQLGYSGFYSASIPTSDTNTESIRHGPRWIIINWQNGKKNLVAKLVYATV
jgi:hypothetical protein